jgi:putative hemolysin
MQSFLFNLLIIAILIAFNAFMAASEIALVSSRKSRLRALADEGNPSAKRVLALASQPSVFLAAIQVGITVAAFASSAFGAVTIADTVEGWLDGAPIDFIANNASVVALISVTAVLSYFTIVFGELIPKTLAVSRAESFAMRAIRPLEWLLVITRPFVAFLTVTSNFFLSAAGSQERARMPSVTQAELLMMLETAEDEGVVEPMQADLVEEALEFPRIVVRSVMVPRVDVIALEAQTSLGDAVNQFFATGFSRMPVYKETPDDLLGILYFKDAFSLLWNNRERADSQVAEAVRPAYFVPESKPIDELLQELRTRRTHVAIVVDEYGGMAGLVTLEDLIEELVGEISDEFDPGYEPIHETDEGRLEVDGRVSIFDLMDRLDLNRQQFGELDAESVGGLIAERLGRIPAVGDTTKAGPLCFTVSAMDAYRVATVLVDRCEEEGDDGNGNDQKEA